MKFKDFKFDRGWKILIYFDLLIPALLFMLAWLVKLPQLSKLFHSYEIFVINTIPNFTALTGIAGLVLHAGAIGYAVYKRNYKDLAVCLIITLLISLFFLYEINYLIIKPLEFVSL